MDGSHVGPTDRGVDALVVGSGPNGLAAAVTLARHGLRVEVLEGAPTPGGGCRTEELTLPGFRHDVCSTVQALVAASPFFRSLDGLADRGVRLCQPSVAFAHPLDGGRAAAVVRSVDETAASLGTDAGAYRKLLGPLVEHAEAIVPAVLGPLRSPPRRPLAAARFARVGFCSGQRLVRRFDTPEARALIAGVSAHAMQPLSAAVSGGFGALLTLLAHRVGWPVVEGGSASLVRVLIEELESLGSCVRTGVWVESLDELPAARVTLLDVTPLQLLAMAGGRLRPAARRRFAAFRYGPGICKVDWALSGPVPWEAAVCRDAGTIHLAGTFEEVARSEAAVAAGRHPDLPYCIAVQASRLDPTRAPAGQHTLWAYCHVPAGSTVDMTEVIEAQVERFATGFRDLVLARSVRTAADTERDDPNYVGGDINSGAATLRQTVFRPTARWDPYRTGIDGVYLCSASTPPGGGVHGMCGVYGARAALRDLGIRPVGLTDRATSGEFGV